MFVAGELILAVKYVTLNSQEKEKSAYFAVNVGVFISESYTLVNWLTRTQEINDLNNFTNDNILLYTYIITIIPFSTRARAQLSSFLIRPHATEKNGYIGEFSDLLARLQPYL